MSGKSHKSQNNPPVPAGIYVRSATPSSVFQEPVGDVALMQTHAAVILETLEPSAGKWLLLFNTLHHTASTAEANHVRETVLKAKSAQTPQKRKVDPHRTILEMEPPRIMYELAFTQGMESYEAAWRACADRNDIPLTSTFSLMEYLRSMQDRASVSWE